MHVQKEKSVEISPASNQTLQGRFEIKYTTVQNFKSACSSNFSGWMVDFGTGEVYFAHGRILAWTTSPMGGVDRGLLGSKG